MRNLCWVICLFLITTSGALAADPYDPLFRDSGQRRVLPQLQFMEASDLGLFREIYTQTFQSLMQQRASLAANSQGPYWRGLALANWQLLDHIEAASHRIRFEARRNLDLSLHNLKSELQNLYEIYQPEGQALVFQQSITGPDDPALEADFLLYGSYHMDGLRLEVDLHMLNLHSGVERSFSARGEPRQAGRELARKLFHHFHRTRFPSRFRLGSLSLELLDHQTLRSPVRESLLQLHRSATMYCQTLQARLPTEAEFQLLRARGIYRGGVAVGASPSTTSYYWALANDRVYRPHFVSPAYNDKVSHLDFLCVR